MGIQFPNDSGSQNTEGILNRHVVVYGQRHVSDTWKNSVEIAYLGNSKILQGEDVQSVCVSATQKCFILEAGKGIYGKQRLCHGLLPEERRIST